MDWLPEKAGIAAAFSAAAPTYDLWAGAQAEVADWLARRLPRTLAGPRTLDVGCGTGLLTRALLERHPGLELLGIDLAPGMVAACRTRFGPLAGVRFLEADAEGFRPEGPLHLLASSAATQWFHQPAQTWSRLAASLSPGGLLAVATLVPGSLPELAVAGRKLPGVALPGLALTETGLLDEVVRGLGLRRLVSEERDVAARFAGAREALRSFRGLGADFRHQPGYRPLAPRDLSALIAAYHAGFADPVDGSVPVTYRVRLVIAERAP